MCNLDLIRTPVEKELPKQMTNYTIINSIININQHYFSIPMDVKDLYIKIRADVTEKVVGFFLQRGNVATSRGYDEYIELGLTNSTGIFHLVNPPPGYSSISILFSSLFLFPFLSPSTIFIFYFRKKIKENFPT